MSNQKTDTAVKEINSDQILPTLKKAIKDNRRAFYYTVLLKKQTGNNVNFLPVGGWRIAHNEDEARGAVMKGVFENHPGYHIVEVIVSELDVEMLIKGLVE